MAMKRYLTVIRHAKSSWADPDETDFDRPLNDRGMRDAPRVGNEMDRLEWRFDKLLCSMAKRAAQTVEWMRRRFDIEDWEVSFEKELYLASPGELFKVIGKQSEEVKDLALVAHNPGVEDLVYLLDEENAQRMATCCVARFEIECDSWSDLPECKSKLVHFIRPKDLKDKQL